MSIKLKDLDKDEVTNVSGVSILDRYKEASKLIDGYNQLNSMGRAFGFKEPYDGQRAISKYRHLINFSDVETVCEWLFENGFDIVKIKK